MQWLEIIPVEILVSALVLIISLIVSAGSRRQQSRLSRDVKILKNDLHAMTTAAVGMGGRVLELERRLRHLAEKQDQFDYYESANQPYDHAISLARQGASTEDLVKDCGLSRNEAELIKMMHRLDQAS
jgi:hypothetical protein